MSENLKSLEKRLRAVLQNSPGKKSMMELNKLYEGLFPDLPKPSLSDIKAMDDIFNVQYSDATADFMVSLNDGDLDNSSVKSTGDSSQSDEEESVGGEGDNNRGKEQLKDDFSSLQADYSGVYSLCFPKNRNYYIRSQAIRNKFRPFHLDGINITPWYVFIRFNSRETAIAVLKKYSSKMDIRIANRRSNYQTQSKNDKKSTAPINSHSQTQEKPEGGSSTSSDTKSRSMSSTKTKKPKESIPSSAADIKHQFEMYRTENNKKMSHLQQELFTLNHKLQDIVIENAKNTLALQTKLSAQEEKITVLTFTLQKQKEMSQSELKHLDDTCILDTAESN